MSILISYAGKMPVEIELSSGFLTLRPNTTATVSKEDLDLVKAAFGERTYVRCITEHKSPEKKKAVSETAKSESEELTMIIRTKGKKGKKIKSD